MTIGTAGLTAGAMVNKVIAGVKPEDGDILVSGATGGVDSVSVALLAKAGYKVVCVTGKESEHDLLKTLGATEIISRTELQEASSRPMLKGRWAGAIDTVGGLMLENIIKSIQPYGVVSCCGNVAGAELNLTVFPFILRGVTLAGVSSQNLPLYERIDLWNKFATDWNLDIFETLSEQIELDEINIAIDKILKGQIKGRTVVHI
jgi:putative YhdH/YhfP family quinone oxidoreductase